MPMKSWMSPKIIRSSMARSLYPKLPRFKMAYWCAVRFIDSGVLFTAPYESPANLTGQSTNSTSIFVQWNAVILPNIRGILRGYRVYYEEAPGSVHASVLRKVSVDISVTEAELINLRKFTEYHIWVTTFTTREGELSNSIFVRTREDSKCVFPASLSPFLQIKYNRELLLSTFSINVLDS